jgi:hypothetical protein
MRMKGFFLTIAAVAVLSTLVFADTGGISYFSARPDGDGVVVEWKSGGEAGVRNYVIERSDVRTNDFSDLTTLAPAGSFTYYKFRDSHVNAMAPASGALKPMADMYKYRIRINYSGEVSYSETISVTRPSSGVRRTWGMIKEMFH